MKALEHDLELAWRAHLRATALLHRTLDAELRAAHGMSLQHYGLLVILSETMGRVLTMSELADAAVCSPSGLTRMVEGLERKNYVTREPDPTNRRRVLVTLTDDGMAALRAAWPTHMSGVRNYFARHLDGNAAAVVGRTFCAVVRSLEGAGAAKTVPQLVG